MEPPRILLLAPIYGAFERYLQMPEGILRIKKYLEKKNILVDVATFKVEVENLEYPLRNWLWLSETGLMPEGYQHKLLADYLTRLQPKIEKRRVDNELFALLKEFSQKKVTEAGQEELEERVLLSQYSLIAISVMTEDISLNPFLFSHILEALRKKSPRKPFAVGGFGAWHFPFQIAGRYKDLDFVIYKWGEAPLEFLAKNIEEHQIKHPLTENELRRVFGIKVFEKNTSPGVIVHYLWAGKPPHLTGKLREIPRGIFTRYIRKGEPAVYATGDWSAVPKDALHFKHEKKEFMEITTQVGCPYGHCTFCDWARSNAYDIIADVEWVLYCIECSKPKTVIIRDACFLSNNTKNSLKILRGLKKLREAGKLRKGFELSYHCRAEAFSEDKKECDEILELMIGAGTKYVQVGFESGSERVLREFKKGNVSAGEKKSVLLEQNVRAAEAIAKAKIGCMCTFIFSSPKSELSDVIKNLEFVTYVAKVSYSFDIAGTSAVLKSNKSPLCQFSEKETEIVETGLVHSWPSDPLAVISAWETARRIQHTNDARVVYVHMKTITYLIDKYLEFISKNNGLGLQQFVEELEKSEFSKLLDPELGDTRLVNTRIWKDYIAKKKHKTTFMDAAKIENEKLKEIIRTKNMKNARDILLGKYDKDFEELIKRMERVWTLP